jgi:hypothetical protein
MRWKQRGGNATDERDYDGNEKKRLVRYHFQKKPSRRPAMGRV